MIESRALGHKVGYCVWTPPDYAESKGRYPIIIVLHGMGGNESHDSGLYGYPPMFETAIREHLIPPCILVFPNGGNSGYRGKAEEMILKEVLPAVERSYRTTPQRALLGFSMGASGAANWLSKYPATFSAAVVWGGGPTSGRKMKNLWVICGSLDSPNSRRQAAIKSGAKFTELPGVGHELGKYHTQTGSLAFQFIADAWKRM